MTSALALLLAVPLGVGTAIFLTEDFLPQRVRTTIGFMVELLAAIPSVVLGLWAMAMLNGFLAAFTPLHTHLGWLPFFSTEPGGPNLAMASLILVVMLLPIITAVSRDSLNQVPPELRQGAYAVGATRWTSIFQVLIPASISGIVGGAMLALGRALGETMAVTMIIGNSTNSERQLVFPQQHHRLPAGQPVWRGRRYSSLRSVLCGPSPDDPHLPGEHLRPDHRQANGPEI